MPWQPFAFVGALALVIIAYEVWAMKSGHDGYTITEGFRWLAQRVPWLAILICFLNGFFVGHCFAVH
jgi:hypothetical protein